MKNFNLTKQEIYAQTQMQTKKLSAVHSGGEAVKASVFNNKIYLEIVNLGSGETITVNTPFAFEFTGIKILPKSDVTSKTITVKNGSDAITDALDVAVNDTPVREGTLDSSYALFDADDNDLVLTSSAHADGDYFAIIDICPPLG